MKNVEMQVFGIGARADRTLALTERTETMREHASEVLQAAGLNGRCWWAARDREPARYKLMVVGDAWGDVTAALDAAGIPWEEVA